MDYNAPDDFTGVILCSVFVLSVLIVCLWRENPSKAMPPRPPNVDMTQTLDFIQCTHTHTCSLGKPMMWFHVLGAPFSSMTEQLQHIHSSISHFADKCAAIVTDDSITFVSSCPPQHVAKTIFRAFINEQKSLTQALYIKT